MEELKNSIDELIFFRKDYNYTDYKNLAYIKEAENK